jgi:hypothetical protein
MSTKVKEKTVSTDVNALQLLPEVQDATGLVAGGGGEMLRPTCFEPTCIITYCSNPMTVIG